MHELKKNSICLVFFYCALVSTLFAAQSCRSTSEIPSTTPSSRFVDNNNGTVSDTSIGLMWTKCAIGLSGGSCSAGSIGIYNWKDALDLASTTTFAGHNDWRLPNIKELSSIIELRCYQPAINLAIFPNTSSYFWSSSPTTSSHASWAVNFDSGRINGHSPSGLRGDANVRLVRSIE